MAQVAGTADLSQSLGAMACQKGGKGSERVIDSDSRLTLTLCPVGRNDLNPSNGDMMSITEDDHMNTQESVALTEEVQVVQHMKLHQTSSNIASSN